MILLVRNPTPGLHIANLFTDHNSSDDEDKGYGKLENDQAFTQVAFLARTFAYFAF